MMPKFTISTILFLSLGFSITFSTVAKASVGTVTCESIDGEVLRENSIVFASVQPSQEGYNLLLVEEAGIATISLNQQLQIVAASSLKGQELLPWNLIAYDGTPINLDASGRFVFNTFVNTRSACQFQGTAIFLHNQE